MEKSTNVGEKEGPLRSAYNTQEKRMDFVHSKIFSNDQDLISNLKSSSVCMYVYVMQKFLAL